LWRLFSQLLGLIPLVAKRWFP